MRERLGLRSPRRGCGCDNKGSGRARAPASVLLVPRLPHQATQTVASAAADLPAAGALLVRALVLAGGHLAIAGVHKGRRDVAADVQPPPQAAFGRLRAARHAGQQFPVAAAVDRCQLGGARRGRRGRGGGGGVLVGGGARPAAGVRRGRASGGAGAAGKGPQGPQVQPRLSLLLSALPSTLCLASSDRRPLPFPVAREEMEARLRSIEVRKRSNVS